MSVRCIWFIAYLNSHVSMVSHSVLSIGEHGRMKVGVGCTCTLQLLHILALLYNLFSFVNF